MQTNHRATRESRIFDEIHQRMYFFYFFKDDDTENYARPASESSPRVCPISKSLPIDPVVDEGVKDDELDHWIAARTSRRTEQHVVRHAPPHLLDGLIEIYKDGKHVHTKRRMRDLWNTRIASLNMRALLKTRID